MSHIDLVLKNGRIIDPVNQVDTVADIAVNNGTILSIGNNAQFQAKKTFDAGGCLVTPGLIDCHVHCYQYATPLGINPDEHCLSRGVTTVVDAGSAGASTFQGLRRYVAEKCKARVLSFVHIAQHGLAAAGCASGAPGGELDSLNVVSVDECVKCVVENRDIVVGIKLRLSDSIADGGKNEMEAYRRALRASERAGVPLMVHHSMSAVPTQADDDTSPELGCPRDLKAGDLYTHTYHPYRSSIVDPSTLTIYQDVINAREKGVLYDVGHGQGSFSWTVAELCAALGFYPDTISTDLHTGNQMGPAYDLPTVMSKFLHLGMPLVEVIRAVTSSPAKAVGWGDRIGSLTPGKEADITVLKLNEGPVLLEDCQSQVRVLDKVFKPVAVWRAGNQYPITFSDPFPNRDAMKLNLREWDKILIRDRDRPVVQ
ncbi:deacetylase Atu3266-like [Saccostrea echinata]|uniref:deacetylase Atu3266-like n=1 Tax=Saccostrea echinata TaxID=191078 RepID=UPI002A81EC96|nr:deacetylase Atu3266-like [Saccostrea echinata]